MQGSGAVAQNASPAVTAAGHTAYTSLVQGSDDLVGLVAYSLYKQDKLEFIKKHHEDTGTAPSDGEVMAFCRTSTLNGPVSAYRTKATYLLSEMYDGLMEESVAEIEEQYKSEMVAELKKTQPFWGGVWQNLMAGLMSWAIVGFVILVLYGHQIGYKTLAISLLGLDAAQASQSKP